GVAAMTLSPSALGRVTAARGFSISGDLPHDNHTVSVSIRHCPLVQFSVSVSVSYALNMTKPDAKTVSEVMRSFVLQRRRGTVRCVVCDREIADTYLTRRYCSNACRQRAKRQRQKGTNSP